MYERVIVKEGQEPLLRRVKCVAAQTFQHMPVDTLKKPQLIIFDYDNTLVDSWPQDFETSNKVFEAVGHPPMNVVEMLQEPHTPAVAAIVERTGLSYEHVKDTYNTVYRDVHETIAPPLPGAASLLNFIKERGIMTAVISNKEEDLLQDTLQEIGWKKHFDVAYGAHPDKPHKPNPQVVKEIIKALPLAIPKDEIFFVGDALSSDIACALQAEVVPIWMSQYSVDELVFTDSGPHVLKMENCEALEAFLETQP